MASECFGATKSGENLGQGSSVRVAMVMAIPVTLEGGKEVKGHRLQRMVQLSPWRSRHLAAAKSYVHRKRREGGISLHSFTAAAVSLNPMLAYGLVLKPFMPPLQPQAVLNRRSPSQSPNLQPPRFPSIRFKAM